MSKHLLGLFRIGAHIQTLTMDEERRWWADYLEAKKAQYRELQQRERKQLKQLGIIPNGCIPNRLKRPALVSS